MAYIIVENGALQGQQFQLGDEAFLIGRHSSCDIVLPIPGVSRKHSQISKTGSGYKVEDLKSRNGIYVNGVPVKKSALHHNDVVNVSRFIMRFFDPTVAKQQAVAPEAIVPPGTGSVSGTRSPSVTMPGRKMSTLWFEDSPGLGASMALDATRFPVMAHIGQDPNQARDLQKRLDIFYQVSQAMSSTTEEGTLLSQILDCLMEVFPQIIRAYVTTGDDMESLQLQAVRHRSEEDASKPLRLSRSVIAEVMSRREALLISDLSSSEEYSQAQSLVGQNICSIMCAPLIAHDEIYGILQAEANLASHSFAGEDLNVLVGIAVQAALFLRNSKLLNDIALETSRRSQLQRYFSPTVAQQVMNNNLQLGGEMRDGCIMFCDIVGYTVHSEDRSPADVIRELNRYFGIMVGIILTEKGTVDKFGGDAIMAVWGAPVAIEQDAKFSISAALQMQNSVVRLSEASDGVGMGIGLHYGEFVAGNIGSNERMEYTVIGEHVNIAARVESKAARDMLLVTESVVHRASDEVLLGCSFLPIPLKGVKNAAKLTSIRGIRTEDGYLLSIPAILNDQHGKITFYEPTARVFKFVCRGLLVAGIGSIRLELPEEKKNTATYHVEVGEVTNSSFYSFSFVETPPLIYSMFKEGIVPMDEISWRRR